MRLTYTGGLDSLSLPDPENPGGPPLFEAFMHTGATHELPEHPLVDAWRARGLLVEAASEPSPVNAISRVAEVARKVRQQRREASTGSDAQSEE